MGARQSKRSVDISAGATKAEKTPAGEPLENGTITSSADEKQVVDVNGVVEETTKLNGSTPHVDEKENTETAPSVGDVKEPASSEEDKTEEATVPEVNGSVDTTVEESAKSPTDESAPAEGEKKRKKKKSWSFRGISFSKKDKSKPTIKETSVEKTETVEEVAEEEAVKEEAVKVVANPESESVVSAVEVPKPIEEPLTVVEEKEPALEVNTTVVTEIPPPLPSSPPPVEAPAIPTPTIVETPAPVQQAEPEVEPEVEPEAITQSEPEDETVGGGEGLAEPPEGLNTSDIEKEVADVPLVNGNHVEDIEESKPSSPDVSCLTEKIEAIKLSNTADISEVTNDLHELNGVSDAIAITNGDGGNSGGCGGDD